MSNQYRKNVAAVIVNNKGELLACERSDVQGAWQLPQGGIHKGESPEEALLRELQEEIGTSDVTVLDQLPATIRYDWPLHLHKRGYIGQEQYYFLVKLNASATIDISAHDGHVEFQSIEWMLPEHFVKQLSGFKSEAYKQALLEFSKRRKDINYKPPVAAEE